MRWSQFYWATLVALVLLEGLGTEAASSPHAEDMLKTLLELDRMYAAVARPSLRSGPSTSVNSAYMEPKVQRALNMLRLQNLDKLYAEKSRPREIETTLKSMGLENAAAKISTFKDPNTKSRNIRPRI